MSGSTKSKTTRDDGRTSLTIEGEMTIYRAAELKRQLIEALDQHKALDLELSKVTEFDCAGLQLVLFAQRTAQTRQTELRLVEPSPVVREVFALLQLAPPTTDPAEGSA